VNSSTKCLNCENQTIGQFCSNCGQKTSISRLTFQALLGDLFNAAFNLDSPFPRTLKMLFLSPELVFNRYFKGKRKEYYSPVRYLLLCFLISFLFGKLIGFDVMELQRQSEATSMNNPQIQQGIKTGRFMAKHLNLFLFIFPFCIALASKIWFWHHKYNPTERIAAGFYLAGQFMVISIIPMVLSKVHPPLFYLQHLLALFYLTYSLKNFLILQSIWKSTFKAFFASIFSIIFYFGTTYVIAYFIVQHFDISI